MLCITFFYTLTYEHVGKIQKKEKKTKHIYIADSHNYTLGLKRKKERHPSTFYSIYMKKKLIKIILEINKVSSERIVC